MLRRQSERLSEKLERTTITPTPVPKERKKAKTNYENVKACLERMKTNNPEEYGEYRHKSKQASKQYRQNMTEEKKAKAREQTRIRMQKYRQKKKETNAGEKTVKKTRASIDQQHKKWREDKQRQAQNMSNQKHTALNKKRREKYAAKKVQKHPAATERVSPINSFDAPTSTVTVESQRTPEARRKCLSRAKKVLPKHDRQEYCLSVKDLMTNVSPRKRNIFNTMGIRAGVSGEEELQNSIMKEVHEMNGGNQTKETRKKRGFLISMFSKKKSFRFTSSLFKCHRKTVRSALQKKSEQSKFQEEKEQKSTEAETFFEHAAVPLPSKKLVLGKTGKAAAVLNKPLVDLYADYSE